MTDYQRIILDELNRLRAGHGKPPLSTLDGVSRIDFYNAQLAAALVRHPGSTALRAFREREAARVIREQPYAHIT